MTRLRLKVVADLQCAPHAVEHWETLSLSCPRIVGLREVFGGVETVVVDAHGEPEAGVEISLRASLHGDPSPILQTILLSAGHPVLWRPAGLVPGVYDVEARVGDPEGRSFSSEGRFRVQASLRPPPGPVLRPDRESYQPGETAHVRLQVPSAPARVLLVLSRGGVLRHEVHRLSSTELEIPVPLLEEHVPGVHLTAVVHLEDDSNGGAPLADQVYLPVSAEGRRLSVKVVPEREILPHGIEFRYRVAVRDSRGMPATHAYLCAILADEDLFKTAGCDWPDPWESMYGWSPSAPVFLPGEGEALKFENETQAECLRRRHQRQEVAYGGRKTPYFLDRPPVPLGKLRGDLCPESLFLPWLTPDWNGNAELRLRLPSWFAHYRLVVFAVQGARQFGRGECRVSSIGPGPGACGIWRWPTNLSECWTKGRDERHERQRANRARGKPQPPGGGGA